MKKIILASSLAAFAFSTNVLAESSTYVSAGYGYLNYSETNLDVGGLGALNFSLGHMFTKNWGVEGRYSHGVSDGNKTITVRGVPAKVTLELDRSISVLGVANYPIGNSLNIFAKAGMSNVSRKGSVEVLGVKRNVPSDDGTSFTFLAGANYALMTNLFIEIEGGSYYNKESVSVTGISGGIKYVF